MEINKQDLIDILKDIQLIQSRLLVILNQYEETESGQCEVNNAIWASTGTGHAEQSMVYTVTR